jgi:hypothetical protein
MNSQCNGFPSDAADCSISVIHTASTNADPYALTIKWPVPDSEISRAGWNGSAGSPALGLGSEDGNLCERMSVNVQRRDPALFASVVGRSGETISATAVGRGTWTATLRRARAASPAANREAFRLPARCDPSPFHQPAAGHRPHRHSALTSAEPVLEQQPGGWGITRRAFPVRE